MSNLQEEYKNFEEIEKINNLKEQKEIINEINIISKYKEFIMSTRLYNNEIQSFIMKMINKYRNKWQVKNYYNSTEDNINENQYNTLCVLETMISQYAVLKFGEDFLKKIKTTKK